MIVCRQITDADLHKKTKRVLENLNGSGEHEPDISGGHEHVIFQVRTRLQTGCSCAEEAGRDMGA